MNKNRQIQYFYCESYKDINADTFWENVMVRLSENQMCVYKNSGLFQKINIPFEYKHVMLLKSIGNISLYCTDFI